MSPHVGNFVADLVEMAKATEELPHVRAELAAAQAKLDERERHNMDLELAIIGYKDEIAALQATLRATEAARDDAEYRFLESDDKVAAFRSLANAFSADLGAIVKASEPSMPSIDPMPEPVNPDPLPTEPPPSLPVEVPSTTGADAREAPAELPMPASGDGQPIDLQPSRPEVGPEPERYHPWGAVTSAWSDWRSARIAAGWPDPYYA